MTETALITGASSGIGRALALLMASEGHKVLLAARREAELEALKAEIEAAGGAAEVFAADLGTLDGVHALHQSVVEAGHEIHMLVNNAGFGGVARFDQQELDQALGMVDLNVKALMALTRLVLPEMVARGKGQVLNVGSTAGLIPGPGQAVYHATKSFVNSFSMALAHELKNTGVTITLLAPGVVDTSFFEAADMTEIAGVKGKRATVQDVAALGYRAMRRGQLMVINDPSLRFLLGWVVPLLPRRLVLTLAARFYATS